MKGWKKPKAFAVAYSAQKRFLAFVLTFAMLFTSVGTDLNVSYAAQGNKVDFEIYGSELVDAINQAVESDNVVTPDSLEFTNGAIDKFETLFYGEGKVYEVYPQIDGGDMDAELRVFVRLPEDADDMYMVTGDEEVIFLYVNNGDETISCATRIIRSVDGEEKVKTTKRINVKSYEDKFGDEEVDIVSKKDEAVEATTAEETTAVEEKPQETAADAASQETTAAEEKETEITDETTEAPAEETTEAETKESEEATEVETEKETAEETEKETSEEAAAAEGEVTASVSRHYAPVVAMKEDAEAAPEKETAEAVETEKEVVETEKETTEAVEKETAEAVETEKETTEAETKDAEVAETETAAEETSQTEETTADVSNEETAAESKENETKAETSKAEETTAEVKEEETKKADAATDSDLVGIGYCSTAKAYTTTVKALKALDDIQGLKVTYAINPEYSARIVDGPRGVEEGDTLVFGVKNQIGYAIESVTANGEFLEADSTSDNEDGSVTAWYTVPEVTEEQEIEVYMTENGEHPAVELAPIMVDGVTINISADEGVLPEGVTATAARVNEDVENAVADKAAEDGTDVASVMAFDINLWLGDKLLDSEIWGGSQKVRVTFSGEPIEQNSAQADAVDVLYVETVQDSSKEEKEKVANEETEVTAADIVSVQSVADTVDVSDGSSVDEISFDAEHFSIYAVVGSWQQKKAIVVKNGETVQLTSDKENTTYSWEITSGGKYVQIQSDKNEKQITVKAIGYSEENNKVYSKAVITCTYANRNKDTFTVVTVKNSGTQTAYFYIRKPGTLEDTTLKDTQAWYTVGSKTTMAVKNAIVDMEKPEGKSPAVKTPDWQSHLVAFPAEEDYPVIKDGDVEYKYSTTGEEGTYSVEWQYIIDSWGATYNDLDKGTFEYIYNSPAYHVDGYAILHKESMPQVNFKVKAVDNTWSTVLGYQVNKNTLESTLVQPTIKDGTPGDQEVQKTIWSNGDRYDFDGWYREDTFKNKVDFANSTEAIATPTTYYGRYVKANSVKVDYSLEYDTQETDISANNYPQEITYVPEDENDYFVGSKVTVEQPITNRVIVDTKNGGCWTLDNVWKYAFDGSVKPAGSEILVTNENKDKLQFTATWTFHKDVIISYVAEEHGSVGNHQDVVQPLNPNPDIEGSTANPAAGYRLAKWTLNDTDTVVSTEPVLSRAIIDQHAKKNGTYVTTTFVAHFERDPEQKAAVTYGFTYENDPGNHPAAIEQVPTDNTDYYVGDKVTVLSQTTIRVEDSANYGYWTISSVWTLNRSHVDEGSKVEVTLDNKDALHFTAVWTFHKYVMIQYKKVGEGNLTIALEAKVDQTSGEAVGSTATVTNENYEFKGWYSDENCEHLITTDNDFKPSKPESGWPDLTTYYAKFVLKTVNYEVHYWNMDNNTEFTDLKVTGTDDAGKTLTGVQKDITGFDFVEVKPSQTITLSATGENVINFYYKEKGNVTLTYKVANRQGTMGSVTPGYETVAPATGHAAGATATPETGYYFVNWTEGEDGQVVGTTATLTQAQVDAVAKKTGIYQETTFVAHFRRELVITPIGGEKVYDGKPLEVKYTINEGALAADDDLNVALVEGPTDVNVGNEPTNRVVSVKITRNGEDVTNEYKYTIADGGKLKVIPRPITLLSANADKTYDGTPLTKEEVKIKSGSFAEGEGIAKYNVTGSQTDVGESKNIYTYELQDNTKAGNYVITTEYGTLAVKPDNREITVTADSWSREYDGTPIEKHEWTVNGEAALEAGAKAAGHHLVVEVASKEGNQVGVGKTANEVKVCKVLDKDGKDVSANYKLKTVDGTLEVTPREIEITSADARKPYDGTPLTKEEAKVTKGRFVDGEGATYSFTGSQTDVGSSKNTFTYKMNEGTATTNYDVTLVPGTLLVTKKADALVLKAKNAEQVYDGTALTSNAYEIFAGKLLDGDHVENVVTEGSQTTVGESANVIKSYVILDKNDKDVTANYTIEDSLPGNLTVTARPITITAASDSKEYNGTPLTANSYTVSENGLADNEKISEITIEGEQVEVGTSSNAVREGSVKITRAKEAANARSAAELEDVTANYNITLVPGELKVTNRYDLTYIVNYHYLDAKGNEVDVETETKNDAFIGEEIAYSDAPSREYNEKTYAFDHVVGAGKTVEYYADGAENPNVVDVYYGLDEIGTNPGAPTTPDGIPDMYQVVFRYISENPSYGTVDGAAVVDGYVMEVVTRPQKADGSYDMDAEVYPLGNVTVTGIGNYAFNHWSDGDTNYANAKEIAGHGFKTDMTFVAHFSYDGGNNNNNNGGNGGGNGGSTSGGGSSSSGSRGSVRFTSGGPGDQTVTIDAGDVPLAELPDGPVSPVEIDDGEVPLAALPKTGQTTMKLTITLMFSGIFLALTAMSKKHKEEES